MRTPGYKIPATEYDGLHPPYPSGIGVTPDATGPTTDMRRLDSTYDPYAGMNNAQRRRKLRASGPSTIL